MESGNLVYIVVEANTANELMLKVNAMIGGGWFLIGGLSSQIGHYAQSMGFRGTPKDMKIDNIT